MVVGTGHAEGFRADPGWLPDSDRLVLFFRETDHGVKAVYDDGHMVEAAIFEPDELGVTRSNDDYAVLLDRGGLAARMTSIRAETRRIVTQESPDAGWLTGQFLTGVLVGVQRHARGERISGHEFVKQYALHHLLRLLARYGVAGDPAALDELNPYRRVESAFPIEAERIDALLLLPTPAAALAMLDLVEERIVPSLPAYPWKAAAVVRNRVEDAAGTLA